jgi:hypothetical protein
VGGADRRPFDRPGGSAGYRNGSISGPNGEAGGAEGAESGDKVSSAARQRRARERRARGVICLRVEVSEHDVANALIASGRLSEDEALRRSLAEREVAEVLNEWCERWRDA